MTSFTNLKIFFIIQFPFTQVGGWLSNLTIAEILNSYVSGE